MVKEESMMNRRGLEASFIWYMKMQLEDCSFMGCNTLRCRHQGEECGVTRSLTCMNSLLRTHKEQLCS